MFSALRDNQNYNHLRYRRQDNKPNRKDNREENKEDNKQDPKRNNKETDILWETGKVGDQGTCGSCAVFTAVSIMGYFRGYLKGILKVI